MTGAHHPMKAFCGILTTFAGILLTCSTLQGAPLSVVQDDGTAAVLDLGRLLGGEKIEFIINLSSAKDSQTELVENFVGSCGCTVVDFEPVIIEAGEKVQISGRYVAPSVAQSTTIAQTIDFKTTIRTRRVQLRGRIEPAAPRSIYTKLISLDSKNSDGQLTFSYSHSPQMTFVGFDHWSLGDEVMSDSLSMVASENANSIERTTDIQIKYDPDKLKQALLRLRTPFPVTIPVTAVTKWKSESNRDISVEIPIEVKWEGPVTVQPAIIDLGILDFEKENLSAEMIKFSVHVEQGYEAKDFSVTKLGTDLGDSMNFYNPKGDGSELIFTFSPESLRKRTLTPGFVTENIQLSWTGGSTIIPVQVFVR